MESEKFIDQNGAIAALAMAKRKPAAKAPMTIHLARAPSERRELYSASGIATDAGAGVLGFGDWESAPHIIVDADDFPSLLAKQPDAFRADQASRAGNYRFHPALHSSLMLCLSLRTTIVRSPPSVQHYLERPILLPVLHHDTRVRRLAEKNALDSEPRNPRTISNQVEMSSSLRPPDGPSFASEAGSFRPQLQRSELLPAPAAV